MNPSINAKSTAQAGRRGERPSQGTAQSAQSRQKAPATPTKTTRQEQKSSDPSDGAATNAFSQSLIESAQSCAVATLQALQALGAQQPADQQAAWKRVLRRQQEVLDFLFQTAGQPSLVPSANATQEGRRELAKLLRARRAAANLTQERLAELAGLSTGTIKGVEAGSATPTRSTLMRLLAVKELGLQPNELPLKADGWQDQHAAPTSYFSPTYEPMRMFLDLVAQLNSEGGYIEQTYAYIDSMSAAKWYALSTDENYERDYRRLVPLEQAAEKLGGHLGRLGIDLICLGSGDARQETRLMQALASSRPQAIHRLFLVDISHALLTTGYRHATELLERLGNVTCYAIHGNFHHLPRYSQLHYRTEVAHRRRVLVMLGHTIANLDNEVRFVRHNLAGYAPGDCLVVDITMAYGSPDKPEEIEAQDPALRNGVRPTVAEWLSGPIRRYVPDLVDVHCTHQLDTACAVRGSYAIEIMAHVKTKGGTERHFSISRHRRHDPDELAKCLRQFGWQELDRIPYGAGAKPDIMLMLFCKVTPSSTVH